MNAAYIQKLVCNGEYRKALIFYAQSHSSSLKPNSFTFPFLLIACAKLQSIPQAHHIHSHILKSGFLSSIHTATVLTSTYLKLRLSDNALKLLDEFSKPTLPLFNAVISGLSQSGHFQQSFHVFKRLQLDGIRPNSITLASTLPSCQISGQGSCLHGIAVKAGHDSDIYVATALVTMFCNFGEIGSAQRVFQMIEDKTVISYNAMISGYLRNGCHVLALDLCRDMVARSGEKISCSSLLSLLTASSELSALRLGKEIHCYSLKCEAFFDIKIGTAIVDMYCKCGALGWAYRLFMKIDNRNIITWNAMISGFLSLGYLDKAVELFKQLRSEGIEPDGATWNLMISGVSQGNQVEAFKLFTTMRLEGTTFPSLKPMTSLLQICSSLLDVKHGKEIHSHAIRTGVIEDDVIIQTALIHMYMACGCSLQARRIFDRLEQKSGDPVLWKAMISGYGRNGEDESALEIFNKMQEKEIMPNSATPLVILSNIYATQGRWNDVERLRKIMADRGLKKMPGCSWI